MDYDRIMQAAQEIDEKNASQAEEAQPEKSTWERLKDWAENTASDVYTAAKEDWEAGQQYLREQQRYIPDTAEEAYENQLDPESTVESFQKQDQDAALQSSIQNYQAANTQLAVAPIRETSREFVNAYADDDSSMAQDWAQSLQKSSLYYDYIGTDEEKANTARKVAEKTGIGEDILLHDEETWKGGLQAYREMKKDQDAQWALEKYPELQDIASKSEAEAIVALHHIAEVSTTHGIIETVQHAFEQGNRELEYNNLMYKVMMGDATEDDRKRAAELRKEIEADRQQAPSIFDDPLAAMAGAVASSAPEMWESFEVAARDAAVTAAIGAVVGAAAGGAGAAPGMLAGGVTGFVRSLVGKAAFRSAVGGMFRVGMWRGMLVPEAGSRYAQYTEEKDENGNPLFTNQEAKNYAMLGGALNAGIEMADFGIITKSLTRTPFTQKVLGDIIAQSTEKEAAKESLKLLAREKAADMFKITLSESGEEALQSATDDLLHNEALREVGADGRRAGEGYDYYSAGEIAGRATNAFVESLPGSLGFGLMGGTGGMMTGSASIQRAMRNHAKFVAKYGEDAKKTVTGAMMYEQLQQAVSESKLQQKAPDINEKVLKKQLEGTGFETVYVDTEMAQENEHGMEDLKKVAKAGGYSDEELQSAIQEKGHLVISGERFAQAGTSPELLEDVSFSQDADSFARMRHDAKATLEEVQQQMQKTLDKQTKLIEGIADEYFPTDKDGMKNKAQRETLMSAVIMRPENPAQGWRQMRKDLQAELDNAIAPALQALHEGMGKGGIILPTEDENGNKTYVRASENDEWYRNFYKLYKRQPTKAELEDMAIAMVTGDPSAPKVPGWVATDKETAKAMAQTKKTIDAIRKQLQVLDDVKEAASSLTGAEVNAIQGLTPEGYHVYRAITKQLRSAGGATSRVARLNAILFARHADIYADIVTKKTGKKYTALDYMRERYGLDLTGDEAAIQKAAEADSQQGTNFAQSVSPKKQLEADEKKFAAAIDDYMSKTDDKGTDKKPVFMMMTPLALNLAGTRTLPIYIDRSILHKVLIVAEDKAKGTHGHANEMSPEILKQLPRKLADPLLIFRSFDRHGKEEPNKRVIVVDLKDRNGATVIVSFVLETRGKVNKIASVYGKGTPTPNNKWITDRINNKALLYVNKKRTTHWLDELARPPIGPLVGDSFDLSSTLAQLKTNYKTENDLKTLKNANPSLYQMAGEKAGTANLQTLQRAQNMEREGKDADTIWNETGWTKGRDGKWRFEIPDELDKVNLENLTDEGTQYLKDVYDNPALYAAYPDLAYVLVQTSNELGKDTNGAVAGDSILLNLQKLDDKDMPVTLIHEIQHLIQHKEGFASGGAPSAANRLAERLRDKNFDAKQAFNQANDTLRAIDYVRTTRNWEKHPRSVLKSSIYLQTEKTGMPKGREAQQEYLAKAVEDSKRAWRAELLEKGGFYSLPELESMSDRKLQNYEKTVRRVLHNSEAGSDLYDEMGRFANTESEEERYEFYKRLAGEQEAYMTEERAKNATAEEANRKRQEKAEKALHDAIKDLPADQQKAVKDFISSRDYGNDEAMATFDAYPDAVVDAMADVMSAYPDSNASNSRPIPHNADAIILFGGKSFKLQIGEESAKKPKNPSLYQMASADTRTEAFKKWFGNSKIVNEDGSPKVVYHGTATDNIRIFDRKKAQDKAGRQIGFGWGKGKFYFTESEMMANAAGSGAQSRGQGEHPQAMPVYLRVEKPISAESYAERFKEISGGRALSPAGYDDSYTMEDRDRLIAKLDRQLKKEGYDGIIDEMSGAIAVFDNKQIKSVNNQGTFDSNNPNIFYQSAWHGSPYDFNEFDLGKIGAGEGGQAHGWGLYFAADRVISNEYKEHLSEIKGNRISYKGHIYNADGVDETGHRSGNKALRTIASMLRWKRGEKGLDEVEAKIQKVRAEAKEGSSGWNLAEECLNLLHSDGFSFGRATNGKLYEADVPENDVLLDEQKLLKDQPPKVQEALERVIGENYAKALKKARKIGRAEGMEVKHLLYKSTTREFLSDEEEKRLIDLLGYDLACDAVSDAESSAYIVQKLSVGAPRGRDIYEAISDAQDDGLGSDRAASEALNKAGIKGITYNGEKDGRCYVIFDDKAISIINKYNQEMHGTAQGFITPFSNGKRIITLLEGADESTFAHEMSHMFLMDLEDLAQIDDVSAKELEVVDKWAEWHEGAGKEYRRTPWAKEFRAREKRILEAEAAGDVETAEKEKQQWRQERFARGWELYLKEGKAPARGLKAVFRKFSDFLRRIYLAFTSDGGKPSESVRRVMDRMIATEDEIEEASLNDRFKDVSEAGGEKLYDETEEQTYKRWHEEAKEEAKEKLRKIVMKDLEQKNRDDFEEKVKEERERYTEYLQNQNVYLAEQAIKESGGDESMAKVFYPSIEAYKEERQSVPSFDEALESHMKEYRQQLDASLIDQHLTPEAVDEAMTSAAYHQKLLAFEATAFAKKQSLIRKISEKTEAAMRSVEDKIEALPDDVDLKVERRTGKVKDIMQAINKLRFSTKWSPEDYQGIERMINSATKDEVREAMKDFRKQAHEDRMNEQTVLKANEGKMQFYRELAERAIEDKPIHEAIDAWGYRREARKAAKRAEQMIHAKRWDVALQAKQQQAMLELEARAAEKMHARVEKLTKRVKQQLSARSVHLPQDERYWHRHLAYELGLAQTDAMEPNGHDSGPDGKPVSGKDIMQLNYLVRMFDAMEKNMDIPDASGLKDILNVITMKDTDEEGNQYRVKRWQRLNIHELEDAVDTLTVLYATGRDRFRMKTIGGKDIADVVQEIVSGPGEAKRMHVTKYNISENTDEGGLAYNDWLAKVPGIGKEMAKRGQEYISSMLQPEKILDALGPAARRYIYGTYQRAAAREGEMMSDAVKKLRKIFSAYSRAEKADWKDKTMKLQTSVGIEPVSKQTVLCMALNFGTESNRQRLCGGLGVTQTDMQTFLEEHMTEKDWEVVQQVWNLISSYWDETVQVEEKLNGVSLKKVEPAPVKMRTADDKTVDLPGGYYPVAYDPEKSSRAADLSNNAEVKRQMSGAQTLGLNRDFVKSRSEAPIERPLLLDLSVLPDHIGQVIHNIGYRVAARDVYRLVNHPDFEEYVTDSMGRTYHQVLKEWATDVWAQTPGSNNQASKLIDRGFEMLRRNSVMAIMGYRLWPVVENASNLGHVMDKIGAKKTFEAVGRFYGKWKESKKLLEKSVFMQNRINSMDRDIRQQPGILSAPSKLGLSADIIKRHAYDMMLYSDLALSAPLWVQSYRDAFPKMVLEVKAQNEANIQAMQEAQERVDKLHSLQLDREDHAGHLRLALGAWRKNDMDTVKAEIDTLNSSPFEMRPRTTPENLRAELADVEHAQKEDQQEIREAELALDKALDLDVLTDQEMLQEAENRAVMKADAAVRDTFGSGETKDLSSIQRQHGLYRALTTFYSFFNTQFNAIFAQYIHAKYSIEGSAIKRWAPFARTMLYRIVIMGMISAALKTVLGTGSDDDKDKWRKVKDPKTGEEKKVAIPKEDRFLKEWEMNMISTMTGGFFIIRDVSTMLMNLAFEGTTYGRSLNPFSVAFRSYDEGMKAIQMLAKKGERDLEIEEQEQKREQEWQERLRKLRGRKRQEAIRQHEEDEKYRKPPQRYTYSDIARRFGSAGSSLTGFPVTLTDAVTGTMQYLNDADGRYDPAWQNILWSALFDKKPVEREIPEKPKKPKKEKKNKKRNQ